MGEFLRLTPIDWPRYELWQSLYRGSSSAGDLSAFWSEVIAQARPFHRESAALELDRLDAEAAPLQVRVFRSLEADPLLYRDALIEQYRSVDGAMVGWLLRLMARAAADHLFLSSVDVFLAYFSEAYRFVMTGTAGDIGESAPTYDGSPYFLQALGRHPDPETPHSVVHPPEAVQTLAAGLAAFDDRHHPVGDLRVLIDFIEDYINPDFATSGLSLDQVVRADFHALRDFFNRAMREGHGVWVRPPA